MRRAGAASVEDFGSDGFEYQLVSSHDPLGNEQSFGFAGGFGGESVAELRVYAVLRAERVEVAPGGSERTDGRNPLQFRGAIV
jgi:hypothetical protein